MIASKLLTSICELARNDENDLSVNLAFVEMLCEVVKHVEGCRWFLKSELWDHILKQHYLSQSIYVTRKTKELIVKFITALQKIELESCWAMIDAIIAPLNVEKYKEDIPSRQEMLMSIQNLIEPDDKLDVSRYIIRNYEEYAENPLSQSTESSDYDINREKEILTVQLLCSLFESLVEDDFSAFDINIIFKNYNLYLWSWETLHDEAKDSKMISSLSLLIVYIIFSTLPRNESRKVAETDLIDTLKSLLFLIQSLAYKRQYLTVNSICASSQKLCSKLLSNPSYLCKEDGITYNFQTQLLFFMALPIYIFIKMARISHTDISDKFADKIFTVTSMSVKRVCYQYRDTLRMCPQCYNIEQLLRCSIHTLIGILEYVHKDQVIVVFQSLMHLFKKFVPDECMNDEMTTIESFELIQKYPNLLMDVLNGIEITIKNYDISWSESLETSCLSALLISLLYISDLTVPLNTKVLRLMHLAISNFLPPNLALLVENFKDSSLEQLGPLLMRKLLDLHWEVRDSTLEVLQTLSFLSALKFPAFQNLLLESNFPSAIISMVECDEESYVRASAIICLQKMVQVKRLWEEALFDKNLVEKMLECLKTEPEGIVRKEAACLITAIYINHELCSEILQTRVHEQLLKSATCDLHWEVKINALTFWDSVIDHETANQGMIDGDFPAVTFSKSSRKIVTLTPPEIKKRLKLVLDELQRNGCLQVLWTALNDTSDLEVARKSVTIISKLLQLLQQYGVVEETCGRATTLPALSVTSIGHSENNKNEKVLKNICIEEDYSCNSIKDMSAADDVITSIMNSQDIELLSSVYCKDDKIVVHEDSKESYIEFVTVNEFIERVSTLNLESIIKVRSDWLKASDDLDSLIDDILAVVKNDFDVSLDNNVNAMDCY
ncbi:integrator complex assembly factor Brat1 isoform X2 [Lycorma delicatula]